MATRFELVLDGEDEGRLRAVGELALETIAECERTISPFLSASLIARVNARAGKGWVEVDADTFTLLETAQAVRRESLGAFDVTVAPVMEALGFRERATADLAAARGAVGGDALLLDRERSAVRFAREDLSLDVGGVGKGHALELAREVLCEHGIERALLHGGTSTVVALGAPPAAEAWSVALGPEPDAPLAHLRDAALSVSASHGRTVPATDGTAGRGHIVDPHTGRPLAGGIAAAVIDTDARRADARSTALCLARLPFCDPDRAPLAWARAVRVGGVPRWERAATAERGPNRIEHRDPRHQHRAQTA
ncbi:MAG: FAD:protein FMN transferase [Planctomycetota bacterium]|jgi:thiamine biosynthesis lipoprotein|nr:FAD:protein FMN transferase [Planctomycetota bacterium]